MMEIHEKYKNSLSLANNSAVINDATFKKLLENCFSILSGNAEMHNTTSLYNSKADVVKEVYAALLSITAESVRQNHSKEDIQQFLTKDCVLNVNRVNLYCDLYEKSKKDVEASLLNIGSHLPHVTDVNWKIDYIVKRNIVDQADGPLFRISLLTEEYDVQEKKKKLKNVNFTCNSQELQDFVYKLKDIVRHCQRLTIDH